MEAASETVVVVVAAGCEIAETRTALLLRTDMNISRLLKIRPLF